jgi:hypothetical protein
MKKTDLIEKINEGISRGKNFMVVKIATAGNPAPEIIINPSENFGRKSAYYLNAYNDDLELITAKSSGKIIKITDVLMTSNLNDLAWFVY